MADAVRELLEGMVPELHELVTYGLLTKVKPATFASLFYKVSGGLHSTQATSAVKDFVGRGGLEVGVAEVAALQTPRRWKAPCTLAIFTSLRHPPFFTLEVIFLCSLAESCRLVTLEISPRCGS